MKTGRFFNHYILFIFFLLGCFFSGNQLLVYYVGQEFAATDLEFSFIIGAMYLGSLGMVLVLGELSERIGKRAGVLIATLCYSAGAAFIALSGSIKLSIVSFFIFGVGTGGIESLLFSLIGDYNGEKTNKIMNLSQAFFSAGAVIGPVLIKQLLETMSFRYIYGAMWIIMAALAIFFILAREIDTFAHKTHHDEKGILLLRMLRNPVFLIYMVVLMLAIGSETAFTYWLTKYYETLGAVGLGAYGLSLYWISSIPGRIIGAYAKNQERFLAIGFVLASVGILLMIFLPTPLLKLIGIILLGVAIAPVYPSISTLGAKLFPKQSASAFSLMVFSCGFGAFFAQPFIGAVSGSSSIVDVYLFIGVVMVILAGLMMLGRKLTIAKYKQVSHRS